MDSNAHKLRRHRAWLDAGHWAPKVRPAHALPWLSVLLCFALASSAQASSPLADAVMRGETADLDALIAAANDINAKQPSGGTALHWAAYREDLAAAHKLLQADADPNVADAHGMTPIILAAITGNARMIERLLEAGANVHQRLPNGETPLMMAARTGRPEALEMLLAHGAEIDATESLRGTTALMWAAAYANSGAVRVLIEHGADVGAQSAAIPRGRGPYMAPPARERIREFVEGTGLRGAAVEFEELDDFDGEGSAVGDAATRTAERIAAAASAIGPQEVPDPARSRGETHWGGVTPLIFAAREGSLESATILVEAGADVNQTNQDGWTPLLVATHNRNYRLGAYLLEHGADPNIANTGGWTPLYIATDNRNIEGGDYPVRQPDMDHLDYIGMLLDAGANPNLRMRSSTETRTIFTQQWLFEDGATPFLRAAQSGDLVLMKLLLEHGADPTIPTVHGVTPLMVASGIGWVEGVTHEWSPEQTYETVEFLIELGADVNAQDRLDGRTALMGAAHKGRPDIVQLLVDHGADLAARDIGSRDSIHLLAGVTWQAVDYAEGLVRVGVQAAIPQPETAALIRTLMVERGLPVPPEGRTIESICVVDICQ